MKELNKSTIIIALAALTIGLGLGWVFFSGEKEYNHNDHQHATMDEASEWTCSMHPQIRQKEPGDCPICGMDLIPVITGNDNNENPLEIKMSPTAMQLANVQTAIVSKTKPVKKLRLTGKVQADESNMTSQTTHISGRIERLLVNTTGEYVKKGQVIAYIYSPELVTAQKELFEAQKIENTNPELLEASKEKLKNWKLTDAQIESILKSKKPIENFPILADQSGVVLNKRVTLGDHVMQGASLYEIANLSKVWVLFDVYESDMSWIKVGDKVSYSIHSLPGKEYSGKVSFIDPVIDPKTRVAKARVIASNTQGELKPEMFASGIIQSPIDESEKAISIPKSAVMWTGKKSVVYVKNVGSNGVGFIMRVIETGASLGDHILVLEGLKEGEAIAIHGTFSIDAAAQLAGKPSMMNPEGGKIMTGHNHASLSDGQGNSLSVEHLGHNSITLSKEAKASLQSIYDTYLSVKESLANDDFSGAVNASKEMQQTINKVSMSLFKGESHYKWMEFQGNLNDILQGLLKSSDFSESREIFQRLSINMIEMTNTFDQPFSKTLYIQHCPMADNNKGADWLSTEKEVRNPYFGASMLKCGSVTQELK